jgi:hypothetical protein
LGGGGAGGRSGVSAVDGTPNLGGGGGGAGNNGAAGGSGVVIIRYADTFADITTIGGGLTYTGPVTSGGYKVYSFTAGTGTVTF